MCVKFPIFVLTYEKIVFSVGDMAEFLEILDLYEESEIIKLWDNIGYQIILDYQERKIYSSDILIEGELYNEIKKYAENNSVIVSDDIKRGEILVEILKKIEHEQWENEWKNKSMGEKILFGVGAILVIFISAVSLIILFPFFLCAYVVSLITETILKKRKAK